MTAAAVVYAVLFALNRSRSVQLDDAHESKDSDSSHS
jgi:hypothetical protein